MDAPEADEIRAILADKLPSLRERFHVSRIQIYGSVARGDASPGSDVDLLVEFSQVPSLFDIARLQTELEGTLSRSVDITTPGGLHPRVLATAMNDAVEVQARG